MGYLLYLHLPNLSSIIFANFLTFFLMCAKGVAQRAAPGYPRGRYAPVAPLPPRTPAPPPPPHPAQETTAKRKKKNRQGLQKVRCAAVKEGMANMQGKRIVNFASNKLRIM